MHAHVSAPRSVRVQVITVSTSRNAGSDLSGPQIQEALREAGHIIAGASLVPDDPVAIGALLDKILGDVGVEAVILTGGTGISARDCTPRVLGERLDRVLPGFGELFRMLSYQQVGAAAMLSTAIGGVARGRPAFALPGSPKACALAMEKLILPELVHLVEELSKETPLPAKVEEKTEKPNAPAAPEVVPEGVSVRPIDLPGDRPPEPELASGWRAGLRALGATLTPGRFEEIPPAFQKMAAAMDVLNSAGSRAMVVLPDGREYLAFGFPDLVHNNAKVLLVRESEPVPEVVALHRWPRRVGICGGEDRILPSWEMAPGLASEERTGKPYEGAGTLFALEGTSIFVSNGRQAAAWDGSRLGNWVPHSQSVGTLLLSWSQR